MSLIKHTILDHQISKITLQSGSGNPLSPEANQELLVLLRRISQSAPKALILESSHSKIFSGGFALPIIATYTREEMKQFLNTFMECIDLILRLPCPSVCAVEGHAVAAGFILSLATDFRVVTDQKIKLGLPEVNLGMPVPAGAQSLFMARSTTSFAHRYCCTGDLFDSQEAERIGYADFITSDVNQNALTLATQLSKKPGIGLSTGRCFVTHMLADQVKQADQAYMDSFLDAWFLAETQVIIQAQAKKLSK